MIIAIEGIDGAGKNTLVRELHRQLQQRGTQVSVIAFPRYEVSIHAQLAREALHGRMGDLTDSAYAMATLFALDRHEARDELLAANAAAKVVLLDRYVASNAAYSLARTGEESIAEWVAELEFGRLELPLPDIQVLLDTPPQLAGERAVARAAQDHTRQRDVYERDTGLQERTWQAYEQLARNQWQSQWVVTSQAKDILTIIE